MKHLCDYGCGQEAKYKFKNGKLCCSRHYKKCPVNIEKIKGSNNPFYNKTHTLKTKEKISKALLNFKHTEETKRKIKKAMTGSGNPNYGKTWNDSEETKRKKSEANKGNTPWNKDKTFDELFGLEKSKQMKENHSKKLKGHTTWNKNISHSSITVKKMSINSKLSIDIIQEKYPTFYKEEEMRYNPDKINEKEIQVHCKNHNCPNSKEKGGWFTPTFQQIQNRKNQLEKPDGNDGGYFYCSQECKSNCILFNIRINSKTQIIETYSQKDLEIWKEKVKELDDSKCQICETKKDIHVHHIIPKKLESFFALDPINGICLCKKCHYKYGHKDECNQRNIANKICQKI